MSKPLQSDGQAILCGCVEGVVLLYSTTSAIAASLYEQNCMKLYRRVVAKSDYYSYATSHFMAYLVGTNLSGLSH